MFEDMEEKLQSVLVMVDDDLTQIKTGRAKPSLVDHIQVEAYEGQKMPLIELASIAAPDPHMLVVSPWDKSILETVEKAIAASEANLNPVVDNDVIRINIPPLTQERREEMVKLVNQRIESGRQMMRVVRNDKKREIDQTEGNAGVSEDDVKSHLDEMQKLFEEYIVKLESMGKGKEEELMEI